MEAESLSSLPFPEWSDSSLNTEVWEPPKVREPVKLFSSKRNCIRKKVPEEKILCR